MLNHMNQQAPLLQENWVSILTGIIQILILHMSQTPIIHQTALRFHTWIASANVARKLNIHDFHCISVMMIKSFNFLSAHLFIKCKDPIFGMQQL